MIGKIHALTILEKTARELDKIDEPELAGKVRESVEAIELELQRYHSQILWLVEQCQGLAAKEGIIPTPEPKPFAPYVNLHPLPSGNGRKPQEVVYAP